MNDKKFAGFNDKLLAKIKEENLTPKPRWQFLLKGYVLYVAGGLALIVGSLAVAVMIYLFKFNDWSIYSETRKSFAEFFLLTLPYFWLVFLGLFVFIVYYNFKHSPRGYKYPTTLLVVISIASSLLFGGVFYTLGMGEEVDSVLGQRAPLYDRVFNPNVHFWSQPEEGRLAGLVIEQEDSGHYRLLDRYQEEWSVKMTSPETYLEAAEVVGQPVHLLGTEVAPQVFEAEKIFPAPAGKKFWGRQDKGLPPGQMKVRPHRVAPPRR